MNYEKKKEIIGRIVNFIEGNNLLCEFESIVKDDCSMIHCSHCKQHIENAMLELIRSDADKFVEEHGGLEAVKSKLAYDKTFRMFTGALRTRDELEKEIQKLKDEKAEVIHTNVEFFKKLIKAVGIDEEPLRTAKERLFEELDKRLMPKGMEWPKFEDGEPVKFWDRIATESDNNIPVTSIGFSHSGLVTINVMACCDEDKLTINQSERIKRESEKVLDADGVEIKPGDTLFYVNPFFRFLNGKEFAVDSVHVGPTPTGQNEPFVRFFDGEWDYARKFSHKDPNKKVYDADGVEIKEGDTVYCIATDEQLHDIYVPYLRIKDLRGKLTVEEVASNRIIFEETYLFVLPEHLTHKEPDSWEKLESDAYKDECEYFGFDGKPCRGCPACNYDICRLAVIEDIIKRARALSERNNNE